MPYILIKLVKKKTLKVQKNTNKPIAAVKVTGYVRGQRIRYKKKKGRCDSCQNCMVAYFCPKHANI